MAFCQSMWARTKYSKGCLLCSFHVLLLSLKKVPLYASTFKTTCSSLSIFWTWRGIEIIPNKTAVRNIREWLLLWDNWWFLGKVRNIQQVRISGVRKNGRLLYLCFKNFCSVFFIIIFYVCKPSPGRRIFLAAEHIGVFMWTQYCEASKLLFLQHWLCCFGLKHREKGQAIETNLQESVRMHFAPHVIMWAVFPSWLPPLVQFLFCFCFL